MCAPPTGSLTISSMSPSPSRSGAVIFSASAASTFRVASRQRIAAHALGRNHAVDAELLHEHAIAHGDAQRPAAAALPAHEHDDWRVEQRHLAEVERRSPRPRRAPRIRSPDRRPACPRRRDRPAELLGQPHHPQRLAVAFGLRVAEVAVDLLLRVAALLVSDDGHRLAVEERRSPVTMALSSAKRRSPWSSVNSVKSRST